MAELILRNPGYCDSCEELEELNTLAQHKRCRIYKKTFLSSESVLITSHGLGTIERPAICIEQNTTRTRK